MMSRLVDLYPYSLKQNEFKLLILKRARDVIYAGQWRMVGGKVRENETADEAARRELLEETGVKPQLYWTIPTVNQFYDPKADSIRQIPTFAAEIDPDHPLKLNHEHTAYAWISEEQVEEYIKWPEQRRIMKVLSTIVTDNQILEEWIL